MPYPIYSYSDRRHRLPANILFQANKLKYNIIVLYGIVRKNPNFARNNMLVISTGVTKKVNQLDMLF